MLKKVAQRNDIVKIIMRNIPNVIAVTGGMGIDYGKEKAFYEIAQKAATKNKLMIENGIYWAPFKIDQKTTIVCGIKSNGQPKEEISLINGLITELKFEHFLKEQLEKFIDPKSKFIKTILETDQIKSFDQAIEKGDIVGVNLRSPQAVILIKVPGYFKQLHQKCAKKTSEELILSITKGCDKVIQRINSGFDNYDQNIIACIAPDVFVVLKWASGDINTLSTIKFFREKAEYIRKLVEDETGLITTVGAGQYYGGIAGLKKSYHDAETALELGEKIWKQGKTYHIIDIGMFISLAENVSYERKAELAYQILGDILRDKDLHKTIKVFFEMNMNLTDAAKKLHLHRNTLIYRLEKINRDYGLDPRKFSDAVQIKLGLLLYSQEEKGCNQKNI